MYATVMLGWPTGELTGQNPSFALYRAASGPEVSLFCPSCGTKCDPMAIACSSCGTVLPGLSDPIRGGASWPASAPSPPATPSPPAWAQPAPAAPAWLQVAPSPAAPAWSQPAAYAEPAPHYDQPAAYSAHPAPHGGQHAPSGLNAGAPQSPGNFASPVGYADGQASYVGAPAQRAAYPQASSWGAPPSQHPSSPQRSPVGVGEDTNTMDAPRAGANPAPAAPQVGGQTMHQPSPYPQPAPLAVRPGSQPASLVGRVKLVVEQGKILGEQYLLTERELIIGRVDAGSGRCPDIDLTAQDPAFVHRQHVRLVFTPQGSEITVYDMGGRNGSYVNNQLIARNGAATLHLGDKLRIGRVVLRLQAAPEIEKEHGKG